MNKYNQIDEMSKAMCFSSEHCTVASCVQVNCETTWLATSLYNAGYRKQNQWISVEDDKPKKNGYYLCWRMTSKCGDKEWWQIDKLYWEDNLWLTHHNTFKMADYVTHWMPLPSPPTEKEH